MEIYVFDGSFEGLLSAVFDVYQRKAKDVKLVSEAHYLSDVFQVPHAVVSEEAKAKRVWAGLHKKLDKEWMLRFYKTYLSEVPESFQDLLEFARYILDNPQGAAENFGNKHVLAVSQMARKVHREKHRMEAFIRFQHASDGIFYAHIEPDFNVLPLISRHFKNRYADQQWIIYDIRRKYGLYYNLTDVEEITFDFVPETNGIAHELPAGTLDPKEELYVLLWKDYFKSTNIPARKNMKLHIRHVPKRYWKYLAEKQDGY